MGIPKLKVYRLDEGYSESNDNDIQSQSGDELLPVVEKNLNLGNVEEMVGVTQRGDARLVIEDENWNEIAVEVDASDSNLYKTIMCPCDGWVLGKGNIQLYLKKKLKSDDSSSSDNSYSNANGWYAVPTYMWDYDIQQVTFYRGSINQGENDIVLNNVIINGHFYENYTISAGTGAINLETTNPVLDYYQSIYVRDMIVFKLGNLIVNTRLFFDSGNGYSDYQPIFNSGNNDNALSGWEDDPDLFVNKAVIKYHEYNESYNSIEGITNSTQCRVPFNNIYNGNRNGRCLHYGIDDTGTSLPDGAILNHRKMDYYEGNCNYKRRIFPLKCKKMSPNNGICNFDYDENWYLDGLMKPVAMETIVTSNNRIIFKPLIEGLQITKAGPVNDGVHKYYPISLISSFYKIGNNYYYPDVYLFYNEINDCCGNIFDFDYDYANDDLNTGEIVINTNAANDIYHTEGGHNFCYLKRQVLAIQQDYGYESSSSGGVEPDLLLSVNENTAEFTLSDSDFFESNFFKVKIYIDGKEVWNTSNSVELPSNITNVSHSSNHWSIQFSSSDEVPKDILVIYYRKYLMVNPLSASDTTGATTYYCGYRVPCYQKTKNARLFVSSFPNWVKGHLNNDLDVFFGNKQYSGVEVQGTAVDTIMPNYVKEGWNAIYSEGAIMFTEEKQEYDWFDIFNYTRPGSSQDSSGGITIDVGDYQGFDTTKVFPNYCGMDSANISQYRLLYQKVCYNVAHYDGIYTPVRALLSNYTVQNGSWYALLDDEDFGNAYGKKWVVREDGQIRRFFESNQTVLPNVVTVAQEEASLLYTVGANDTLNGTVIDVTGSNSFVRLWPDGDRILAVKYVPGPNTCKIYLNPIASENDYGIMSSDVSITGDVALNISMDNGVLTINNDYPLPPMPPFLTDCDLSHVQTNVVTIGLNESSSSSSNDSSLSPVLYRYKCTDEHWDRNVYVEVFSYNYNDSNVSYIEFIIYSIKK